MRRCYVHMRSRVNVQERGECEQETRLLCAAGRVLLSAPRCLWRRCHAKRTQSEKRGDAIKCKPTLAAFLATGVAFLGLAAAFCSFEEDRLVDWQEQGGMRRGAHCERL